LSTRLGELRSAEAGLDEAGLAEAGPGAPGFSAGIGYAIAHHGELLQGVFEDGTGRLRRALVTMPLPSRGSRAVFYPSQNHWGVVGAPGLTKARRAAIYALREFSGHPSPAKGGRVEITSNVPHGIGMGSSTSDVAAVITAVADYHGVTLSREEVGRLAVLAEVASDSVMIDDRVVLFAHRDGLILETLGHRLPPMIVVGCDTAPGQAIETLGLPPADYSDKEAGEFQALRGALRRAIATEDVALLGKVATASARINQRYLPKPGLEALIELGLRHGGAGLQIAHSGTVAGLIFDVNQSRLLIEDCVLRIKDLGFTVTDVIEPPGAPAPRAARRTAS
jgi:uncharacterized protein involved in propanediol utilization